MATLHLLLAKDIQDKSHHNYRRLSWEFNLALVVNGKAQNRIIVYRYSDSSKQCTISGAWNPTLEDIIADDWEAL